MKSNICFFLITWLGKLVMSREVPCHITQLLRYTKSLDKEMCLCQLTTKYKAQTLTWLPMKKIVCLTNVNVKLVRTIDL